MGTQAALRSWIKWTRRSRWADERRTPRTDCSGRYAGVQVGGAYHIVALHNLSAEGACVDLPVQPAIGSTVKITSGSLKRAGRVCWTAHGRAGVEFSADPIWLRLL